jgi:hypothetical protein
VGINWTGKKRTCPKLKHATTFLWDAIPDDERLIKRNIGRYRHKQEAGRKMGNQGV